MKRSRDPADDEPPTAKRVHASTFDDADHVWLIQHVCGLLTETTVTVEPPGRASILMEADPFYFDIDGTVQVGFADMDIELHFNAAHPYRGYTVTMVPRPETDVTFAWMKLFNMTPVKKHTLRIHRGSPAASLFQGKVSRVVIHIDFDKHETRLEVVFQPNRSIMGHMARVLGNMRRIDNTHYAYEPHFTWKSVTKQIDGTVLHYEPWMISALVDILLEQLGDPVTLLQELRGHPYKRIRFNVNDTRTTVRTWDRTSWLAFVRFVESAAYRKQVLADYDALISTLLGQMPDRTFFAQDEVPLPSDLPVGTPGSRVAKPPHDQK